MIPETLLPSLGLYLQLVRFFIVLAIGAIFTRAILMPIVQRVAARRGGDKSTVHTFSNLAGIIGGLMSFVVALQAGEFGSLVTVLGTITAALTVAIGFGMRDQIGNLVSGFFIYADRPFLKGDFIRTGETEGKVREIKLKHTVLESPTSEKLVVPNGKLTGEVLINPTKGNKIHSRVSFKESAEKATKLADIGLEKVKNLEKVLEKPGPEKLVRKIEEGKKEIEIGFWMKESENPTRVKSSILEGNLQRSPGKRGFRG